MFQGVKGWRRSGVVGDVRVDVRLGWLVVRAGRVQGVLRCYGATVLRWRGNPLGGRWAALGLWEERGGRLG